MLWTPLISTTTNSQCRTACFSFCVLGYIVAGCILILQADKRVLLILGVFWRKCRFLGSFTISRTFIDRKGLLKSPVLLLLYDIQVNDKVMLELSMKIEHLGYGHKHRINGCNRAGVFGYETLQEGGGLNLNEALTGL